MFVQMTTALKTLVVITAADTDYSRSSLFRALNVTVLLYWRTRGSGLGKYRFNWWQSHGRMIRLCMGLWANL